MKLKNILLGAASAIAIFATVACQEVDPNDRLIYVKPAEVGRAVLIEDFTGQKCINCPNGTNAINNMKKPLIPRCITVLRSNVSPASRLNLLASVATK